MREKILTNLCFVKEFDTLIANNIDEHIEHQDIYKFVFTRRDKSRWACEERMTIHRRNALHWY